MDCACASLEDELDCGMGMGRTTTMDLVVLSSYLSPTNVEPMNGGKKSVGQKVADKKNREIVLAIQRREAWGPDWNCVRHSYECPEKSKPVCDRKEHKCRASKKSVPAHKESAGFRPHEKELKNMRKPELLKLAHKAQRHEFVDAAKNVDELTVAQLVRLISRATKWPLAPVAK